MPTEKPSPKPDYFSRILLGVLTLSMGWAATSYTKMGETVASIDRSAAAREVRLDALAEQVRDLKQSQLQLASDMRAEQARLSAEWREGSEGFSKALQEVLVELARLSPREVQPNGGK